MAAALVWWALEGRTRRTPAGPITITPFTTGGGEKESPRLSPDGRRIALQVVEGVLVGQDTGLGDGVGANDESYDDEFPYLALPHSGGSSSPH